jgi:sec-independent protein translocase protein TatC
VLAKPLLDALPNGGSMIATEVTATFFVPMKLTMLVAFLISLPNTLYQCGPLSRRVCTATRKS